MPRFAKARDAAEPATIAALVADGWSVSRLEPVGRDHGLPDLVIGRDGLTTLAEIKNSPGPKGGTKGKKLTAHQEKWHREWLGANPLMLDRETPQLNLERANEWLLRAKGWEPGEDVP